MVGRVRKIAIFSALLLLVSMSWAVPVRNVDLDDPAEFFLTQLGGDVGKKISQFLINDTKLTYITLTVDNRDKAERLVNFLERLQQRHGAMVIKRETGKNALPSPLFRVNGGNDKGMALFSVDYAVPITSAADKKEVKKVFRKIYRDVATAFGLFSMLKLFYCTGVLTPDDMKKALTRSIGTSVLYYVKLKKTINKLKDPRKKREICSPIRLVKVIDALKPITGFSFVFMKKSGEKWVVRSLSTAELKFVNFLPLVAPGEYYLPLTVPEIRGCGELLDVMDVQSYKGTVTDGEMNGKFKILLTEEEPDYMLDCVTRNYRERGWMSFDFGKIVNDMKKSVTGATEKGKLEVSKGEDLLRTGMAMLPVVTGEGMDVGSRVKGEINDIGNRINTMIDKLGELGDNLTQNMRIFFANGSKGGMAVASTGSIEVDLGDTRKIYTTVMLMEMK